MHKGGEYLQIHTWHSHGNLSNPHTHRPQINIDPSMGISSSKRLSDDTNAKDINYGDKSKKDGKLRACCGKKIKENIELSQFLICKSQHQMTKYGVKIEDIETNKSMYMQAIDKYMQGNVEKIWVVNNIHDMIDNLAQNLNIIDEISRKSEVMVFWYGTDFEELDLFNSRQQLMNYLQENINNPCLEIYLYVNCMMLGSKEFLETL